MQKNFVELGMDHMTELPCLVREKSAALDRERLGHRTAALIAWRTIVVAVVAMLLTGAQVAAQTVLESVPARDAPAWMQQLAIGNELRIRDLPRDSVLVVRAVHGGQAVVDFNSPVTEDETMVVEVATFLVELYNRPCDGAPALFVNVRAAHGVGGNVRERMACLATTPRNVIAINLPLDQYEGQVAPLNVWVPLLLLEAVPEQPPIAFPEDLLAFFVLVSTTDAIPPLPEVTSPGSVVQGVHDAFD
ncbi:MAG: hypothetical protein WD336_02200 [Trueperaceae bacterium]